MKRKVVSISLRLTPLSDTILPPVSSKVLKNMVKKEIILPFLKPLIDSRANLKPLFISNLGTSENERLFSTGNGELVVKAGSTLYGRISAVTDENIGEIFKEEISKLPAVDVVETPYGEFKYEIWGFEVTNVGSRLAIKSNIKVTFVTPTLLSSKMYLPPWLAEKYKGVDVGFSLLPTPGLIASASFRSYCSAIGRGDRPEVVDKAFKLNILVNSFSRVINYDLKPVTVVLGNDGKGNLRKTRGVKGWIEFDVVHDRLRDALLKYLNVARFLGIGRSRGLGLGEISVTSVST